MSRVQLQGVLEDSALEPSAVVEQLNALEGFDVHAFMPRGAEPTTDGAIDIYKQFDVLAKTFLLIVGLDIASVGGNARVDKLRVAFQDGIVVVTSRS